MDLGNLWWVWSPKRGSLCSGIAWTSTKEMKRRNKTSEQPRLAWMVRIHSGKDGFLLVPPPYPPPQRGSQHSNYRIFILNREGGQQTFGIWHLRIQAASRNLEEWLKWPQWLSSSPVLGAGFNWLLADSLTLGLRQVPDVPTAPKPLWNGTGGPSWTPGCTLLLSLATHHHPANILQVFLVLVA